MAQRVSLGRALVNSPALLLLDEPFSFLDIGIRQNLYDKLQETVKQKDTTVLMVSHNIEEAVYLSNRILVMTPRPGSIIRSYNIDLPFPRKRTDSKFVKLVSTISDDLQKELKLI